MAPVYTAFLFTDIEGSTRRWDAYPDAMRSAVRRHDDMIRLEVASAGGHIFKALGDAFCAAYAGPRPALEAAVAIQRALHRQDFSAVGGLRVRIAIAAGEVDVRDGDYFGGPLNRAARLLDASNGGQILLSAEAAEAIAGEPHDGVALRHLGTVALRDLKEPVRVYQAFADGVAADFRPLRTLRTPPNNLPLQTTSFVGRNADVLQVQQLLEQRALVTIGGAGGMGKTRLALEIAASVLNDRKDGAWFVDLAAIVEERLVVGAIMAAVGAEASPELSSFDALIAHLQAREMLLVLDNCEHVIAESARIATAILQRCAQVAILATSRERLDIAGEQFYQLDSLPEAAAVQLFHERAKAVNGAYAADRNAPQVAEICRRLDGMALGIELAAAAVRTMPVRTLLEHFDLRLLAGGRDRQPRQQTMNALISWSYELLNARERDLLRRCAPCVGGFTLQTAVVLAGGDDIATIDLLSSLVDKSLVTAQAARARYRLLEPIRQFALDRLIEHGEFIGAMHAHARAYAGFARDAFWEWDTMPAPDWLERMQADIGNIRAALSWCASNAHNAQGAALAANSAPVFLRLAAPDEGLEWCERFLGALQDAADPLRAQLYYVLSMCCQNLGKLPQSLAYAERAVNAYRQLPTELRGLARSLSQLAHRYTQSRPEAAKAVAEEAMQLAQTLDDARLRADVLRRSAPAFATEPVRMNEIYAESVRLFRSLGHDDDTARALVWWGQSEAALRSYSGAAQHLAEARTLAGTELASALLSDAVSCYLAIGDAEKAATAAREELARTTSAPHVIETPIALIHIAALSAAADAQGAASLSAYAQNALQSSGWDLHPPDDEIVSALQDRLRERLSPEELAHHAAVGAAWTRTQALAVAARLVGAWT